MKFRMVDSLAGLTLGLLMVAGAHAGWGSSGGYYGGSSGYGSSGGYTASYASYGSSGGYASYGSSGGYAASYGSSGYASYGSSGGGILHRMAAHIHDHMAAKRARHAARRAYYGSSGYASYGSSGGYSTSYGSSGGYARYSSYGSSGGYSTYSRSGGSSGGSVSYGSTGATSYGGIGATYYGASKASAATPVPLALASSTQTQNDTVHLTVSVPNAAVVYVNGNLTTSQGAVRQFVSRGLESGKDYRFQIRAELKAADGETLTDEQEVVVQAGQRENLQFAFADSNSPIETAVTLHVPEDAVVRLAGSETQVVGEARVYRTQRLMPGEVWDDYEIEVTHGDQVKTQKIRLIAGDKLQLTFNFDETPDRLAAR